MLHVVSLVLVWAALATAHGSTRAPAPSAAAQLIERWGVVVESVRQTAGGHAVDFRYRVVDANKAASLFMRDQTPYMLDQTTGKAVAVVTGATVGALRNAQPPVAGRLYVMLFSNPRGLIKPGGRVSVVIGDFKVADLVVE